jgi:hydroxymethylglutaryl-CoA synthase
MARAQIDPRDIRAVWVGSESHPYAVKPTSTIVAESIGAVPNTQAADWEFACKAGTEAMQAAIGFVGSGMARYALSIGMDTAQGRPGDALEYTAAAGGAAILIGPSEEAIAIIEGSYSFVTDTPDFWRRAHSNYPSHGDRFTGEPAYFKHIMGAAEAIMAALGVTAAIMTTPYSTSQTPNSRNGWPRCWASRPSKSRPVCSARASATPTPARPLSA